MTQPEVLSREGWPAARGVLLAKETEQTRARGARSAQRRELRRFRIDKDCSDFSFPPPTVLAVSSLWRTSWLPRFRRATSSCARRRI